MKRLFALALSFCFMSVFVAKASPPKEHGQLKYEQSKAMQVNEAATSIPITCLDCTLPDVISVPEPCYNKVTLSYFFVEPSLNPFFGITSRCNSPPFT